MIKSLVSPFKVCRPSRIFIIQQYTIVTYNTPVWVWSKRVARLVAKDVAMLKIILLGQQVSHGLSMWFGCYENDDEDNGDDSEGCDDQHLSVFLLVFLCLKIGIQKEWKIIL